MSEKSKIEWTQRTWNPITGCNKVSPGCKHCYAERMAKRLQAMGVSKYRNAFKVTVHPEVLEEPLKWKKPQMVFVNSMSDLFHPEVPIQFVDSIFDVMNRANWHVFQILTKRSRRLKRLHNRFNWAENIWMGATVENCDYTYRIDDLRQTNAKVKFISFEPLLGPIGQLNLDTIDWVIVGGESGPGARPMAPEWVREIRDQCVREGIAFFFKQWGGVHKKKTGRILDGHIWDEMPSKSTADIFRGH